MDRTIVARIIANMQCMTLPKKAIEEFKELYFKENGVMLSDLDATEKANLLFDCLEVLFTNNYIDKEKEKVRI